MDKQETPQPIKLGVVELCLLGGVVVAVLIFMYKQGWLDKILHPPPSYVVATRDACRGTAVRTNQGVGKGYVWLCYPV
jgi:hypothetical protein